MVDEAVVFLDIGVLDFLDIGDEDFLDVGPVGVVPILFSLAIEDSQVLSAEISDNISLVSEVT